jgi:cytochrome P450
MILNRYREVASALRDPDLGIVGGAVDELAHRQMREQARHLYSPERITDWRSEFTSSARRIAESLTGEIELVRDFAEPWSAGVAALVTEIGTDEAGALVPAAQIVFSAGTSPDDESLRAMAGQAAVKLASRFSQSNAALHTQAFVALAVSMPAFLGNAWLALLENPAELEWIAERGAIDELLRFAGPSLTQYRLLDGQRIELRLAEANRDPGEFADPDRLDLRRQNASAHLAFGGGPHACVGGPLVRAACAAAMPVFRERFGKCRLIRSEPYGGAAIRGHRVHVI